MTEPNATAAITDVSLVVGTVTYEYSDTVAADLVISQNPIGGTTVSVGSSVDLVVSLGQPEVPNVVGMTEPNATAAITAVDNLTVGTVTYDYSDTVAADLVISQNPAAYTAVPIGSSVDLVISLGQPEVPNVVGMTEPNAIAAITAVDNLTVGAVTYEYSDTVAAGLVISQNPIGGTIVSVGSSVDLVVSLGPQTTVPNVVGMTEADANSAISDANLVVGTITYEYSDTIAAGNVISQDPVGGTIVPMGTAVDIVVSLGEAVVVPNVVNMTEAEANSAITDANLIVGTVTYEHSDTVTAGRVIRQNPVGGAAAPAGSPVDLVVSSGQPVVPNVVGQVEASAKAAIEAVDNLVAAAVYGHHNSVQAGEVISQNPVGGTVVNVGSTVNIVVSLGRPVVPGVVGQSEAAAVAAIEGVDNLVAAVTYDYHNTVPADNVISQDPAGGTAVDIGTTVNIVVSLGRPNVPNVVGMTLADATTAIQAVDNLVAAPSYRYDS
jgi:beta-lactam-binding protein with PASTA domain